MSGEGNKDTSHISKETGKKEKEIYCNLVLQFS